MRTHAASNKLWHAIKERLASAHGSRLKGVVIYGSEAAGRSDPDSDIDVMVLLEGPISLWADIGRCVDPTYPLALEIRRPTHAQPVDVEEYEKGDFALYRKGKAVVYCCDDPLPSG